MPWFHRDKPGEHDQRHAQETAVQLEAQLQEQSLAALHAGGLPVHAQERIGALHETGGSAPLFSSDLSTDELLLARQTGYEPIGLVAGSSVFHIGWNSWTLSGELDAQTRALYDAVHTALDRLRQEAQGLRALGVVGVDFKIARPGWGEHLVEVIVLGTAVRARGGGPASVPFLSDLSMQDYVRLLRAGSRPAGLVFGNSTHYIYTTWRAAGQNMSWFNQEVGLYSAALRETQRAAFGRMHGHARTLGAHGVVGVHIAHTLHRVPRGDNDDSEAEDDYVIEYMAWGTAIIEAPADVHVPAPLTVIDLEETARPLRATPGSA